MKHGHRKLSALLATVAGGEVVGVDLLLWFWSLTPFQPMPEDVATSIMTLLAVVVMYFTKEEVPEEPLLLDHVVEEPGQAVVAKE